MRWGEWNAEVTPGDYTLQLNVPGIWAPGSRVRFSMVNAYWLLSDGERSRHPRRHTSPEKPNASPGPHLAGRWRVRAFVFLLLLGLLGNPSPASAWRFGFPRRQAPLRTGSDGARRTDEVRVRRSDHGATEIASGRVGRRVGDVAFLRTPPGAEAELARAFLAANPDSRHVVVPRTLRSDRTYHLHSDDGTSATFSVRTSGDALRTLGVSGLNPAARDAVLRALRSEFPNSPLLVGTHRYETSELRGQPRASRVVVRRAVSRRLSDAPDRPRIEFAVPVRLGDRFRDVRVTGGARVRRLSPEDASMELRMNVQHRNPNVRREVGEALGAELRQQVARQFFDTNPDAQRLVLRDGERAHLVLRDGSSATGTVSRRGRGLTVEMGGLSRRDARVVALALAPRRGQVRVGDVRYDASRQRFGGGAATLRRTLVGDAQAGRTSVRFFAERFRVMAAADRVSVRADADIQLSSGRTRVSFDVRTDLRNIGGGRVVADVKIRQRGDARLTERVAGSESYRDVVGAIEHRLVAATLRGENTEVYLRGDDGKTTLITRGREGFRRVPAIIEARGPSVSVRLADHRGPVMRDNRRRPALERLARFAADESGAAEVRIGQLAVFDAQTGRVRYPDAPEVFERVHARSVTVTPFVGEGASATLSANVITEGRYIPASATLAARTMTGVVLDARLPDSLPEQAGDTVRRITAYDVASRYNVRHAVVFEAKNRAVRQTLAYAMRGERPVHVKAFLEMRGDGVIATVGDARDGFGRETSISESTRREMLTHLAGIIAERFPLSDVYIGSGGYYGAYNDGALRF